MLNLCRIFQLILVKLLVLVKLGTFDRFVDVGDAADERLVEFADVALFAYLDLVAIVVNCSAKDRSRISILLVTQCHESKDLSKLLNELNPTLDLLSRQIVFSYKVLIEHFGRNAQYLDHKIWQSVVHLEQTVKIARVANVPEAHR